MLNTLALRQSTTAGNSANDQLLKLVSNPFQGQIQVQAFWASFGVSIGVTAALALLFSLLRPRHTLVYAPKTKHADAVHAPPPMGKGPFSWVKPIMKTKEDTLVEKIGLDAVVFLRFTRMLRNIFCILAVLGIAIMIPVNITQGVSSIVDKSNSFAVMTPLYIFGNGLWAQVIMAYVINIIVAYFLWHNYRRIFILRRRFFESTEYQRSLHARTVLARHLPKNMCSDEGIIRITDEVNPTGVAPQPKIGRNVRQLPELLEKHDEAVRKLESVLAKYLKNPDRLPAQRPVMKPPHNHQGQLVNGKIDSINFYRDRIATLEQRIDQMRHDVDLREGMPYGFATWDHVAQAHTVAFTASKKHPQGAEIELAPTPNDLIWQNMSLSKGSLKSKAFMNIVWVTVLTIIWTPINAGIAIFLSNLSNLGSVWPGFQRQLRAHQSFWALVQGILAPAITSAIYLCLPIIFRRLQIRAGDHTKTARERHVLRNLYLFFVLNNLIIFSLFSAVWQYITSVISKSEGDKNVWNALKEGQFFLTLTTSMCQISPFWVIWILQRNLGAAIDLAQLWTLFYQWFAKTFLAPTPRQHIEWTAPAAFQYSSYYNYFLFYATVALCFAVLQPIILLATAIYFVLDVVLKKYLLMYVFVTKTESGGQFWRVLFNRMVFACVLSDVIIGVTVKARGTWTMVIALAPLLLLMIGFKWYCMKTFDPGMHYYHRSGMQDVERTGIEPNSKAISRAAARIRHPALDQKLITPMVSAKAHHVIRQIYSGRLSTNNGHEAEGVTSIQMEPMKQGGQPPQDVPFEMVPEAQQDFMYYKNRADFKEAAGNVYGKPEDLIDRVGTPVSLMSGRKEIQSPYSDQYSRPSSPAAGIRRKHLDPSNVHPALKAQSSMGSYDRLLQADADESTDLGLGPRHGIYTDPNDDRANLLHGAGDIRTPNGEFMNIDQWRTNDSTPSTRPEAGGSYDYFRGGHR